MLTLAAEATDKPVWFLFGATAVLAFAGIRALGQLAEVKTDRHLQFLSDFGKRWDSRELWEAREKQIPIPSADLALPVEQWFSTRAAAAAEVPILLRVPNFFEDLAITVDAGNIDGVIVDRAFGSLILNMWAYWAPAIQKMRETERTSYIEFDHLAREIQRIRSGFATSGA